jgi:hypothetical protein
MLASIFGNKPDKQGIHLFEEPASRRIHRGKLRLTCFPPGVFFSNARSTRSDVLPGGNSPRHRLEKRKPFDARNPCRFTPRTTAIGEMAEWSKATLC